MRLLVAVAIVSALWCTPGSERPVIACAAQQTVDQQRDAVDGINRASSRASGQ